MGISLVFIHGFETKPYAGPLRPFINWAKYMIKKCPEIELHLVLFKSSPEIVENLNPDLREKVILATSSNKLAQVLRDLRPDIIISDDYFPRLKLLSKIAKEHPKSKTAIYVQFLRGLHSISRCFFYDQVPLKEKLLFKLSSLIPYKLLTYNYVKLLRMHDLLISNSRTSKDLLFWLYKIPAEDVVYPPVDTEVFRPHSDKEYSNSDSILIYLGSSGGDVNVLFVRKVIEVALTQKLKVNLFGNNRIGKSLERAYTGRVKYHENVSDAALARLYSKALATLCPQVWELFGYTSIESMACGTPVLAFNYFGHSETIINKRTGLLANSEEEFLENLERVITNSVHFDHNSIRKYVEREFSPKKSVNKLKTLIKRLIES